MQNHHEPSYEDPELIDSPYGVAVVARESLNASVPILSLHPEITMIIFNLACNPSPLYLGITTTSYDAELQAQLIQEEGLEIDISHVCHTWRQISINCPELWSNFKALRQRFKPTGIKERLITYLDRAKAIPMNMWAHCADEDSTTHIFRVLGMPQYRGNWGAISLLFTAKPRSVTITVDAITGLQKMHFPNLTSFEISRPGWNTMRDNIPSTSSTLVTMPRLTHLRIDHKLFQLHSVSHSTLSVLQLENSLWSDPLPWSMFSSIISTLVNLTVFTIGKACFAAPNANSSHSQINAPKLEYLRCANAPVAQWIWELLHAPRLKLLAFKELDFTRLRISDTATSPFSSLDVLAFIDCNIQSTKNITTIVRNTQSITRLVVSQDNNSRVAHAVRITADNHGTLNMLPLFVDLWPSKVVSRIHVVRMGPIRVADQKYLQHDISRVGGILTKLQRILGWKLYIESGFARAWKECDRVLYDSLQKRRFFEPSPNEWDCAPVGDADPRWVYEAGFALY